VAAESEGGAQPFFAVTCIDPDAMINYFISEAWQKMIAHLRKKGLFFLQKVIVCGDRK
jgi:hypothetical protein